MQTETMIVFPPAQMRSSLSIAVSYVDAQRGVTRVARTQTMGMGLARYAAFYVSTLVHTSVKHTFLPTARLEADCRGSFDASPAELWQTMLQVKGSNRCVLSSAAYFQSCCSKVNHLEKLLHTTSRDLICELTT